MPLLDALKTNFKLVFSPSESDLERNFKKIIHSLGGDPGIIHNEVKYDRNRIRYYSFNATLENAILMKKVLTSANGFQMTDKYQKIVTELYTDELEFREIKKEVNRIKALDPNQLLEVINGKFFIEGYEFKTEPWKHQRTGFLLIKFLKSIMLNWDMRTGKTFTVANAMQYFSRCTDLKKTLVLAPSGIMESTWIRDVYKHTDLEGYAATQKSNKQRLISLDRGNITMPMDNGRYKEFSGTPDYFVLNHDSI